MTRLGVAVLSSLGVVVAPGTAAAVLTEPTAVPVPPPRDVVTFGASVAGLGDVDADGVADVLVGAPGSRRAYAVSGAMRTILYEIAAPSGHELTFGSSVAVVGDLDGDNVTEVAVGAPAAAAPSRGEVFLFSGATGALLRRLVPASGDHVAIGHSVAGTGDLSGDGVPDILVSSAPFEQLAGSVFAFSGADGEQLWSRADSTPQSATRGMFGKTVVASPDVSGDGVPDVLVAAPPASPSSSPLSSGGDLITGLLTRVLGVVGTLTSAPPRTGHVHVLSGTNGAVLRSIADPALAVGDVFGAAMAVIGDQDGDGVVDHLIAEAGANQLHVYSGRDGRLVRSYPVPGAVIGAGAIALGPAGDKDGDGLEDAWVGVAATRTAYLVNASGAVLVSSRSASEQGSFGTAIATLAAGANGGAELAIGEPSEPGGGAVYLLHFPPSAGAAAEPVLRVRAQTATSTTVTSTTTTTTIAATTTTVIPTTTVVPTTTAANVPGPTATLPKPADGVATNTGLANTGGRDRSTLGALVMALGIGGITAVRRQRESGLAKSG